MYLDAFPRACTRAAAAQPFPHSAPATAELAVVLALAAGRSSRSEQCSPPPVLRVRWSPQPYCEFKVSAAVVYETESKRARVREREHTVFSAASCDEGVSTRSEHGHCAGHQSPYLVLYIVEAA
jgi:hypothetical protein